jgi:hypothetical protein
MYTTKEDKVKFLVVQKLRFAFHNESAISDSSKKEEGMFERKLMLEMFSGKIVPFKVIKCFRMRTLMCVRFYSCATGSLSIEIGGRVLPPPLHFLLPLANFAFL